MGIGGYSPGKSLTNGETHSSEHHSEENLSARVMSSKISVRRTWWPRVISANWGYSAKTWVGWGAVAPDGRLFLYREYVREKTSIEEWGADVRTYISV